MANLEHVKRLLSSAGEWNEWRESCSEKVDLLGARLAGADLREVDLFGVDLSFADLSEADLSRANLGETRLRGTDLSGAKLAAADLGRADLDAFRLLDRWSVTNLAGAVLHQTRLTEASLRRACLEGADLTEADLSRANLDDVSFVGANLSRTKLFHTRLSRADLQGANLDKAQLGGTVFSETLLRGANGLGACRHLAPSSIDLRTLQNAGTLPEVFLRGCGLSEAFLSALPALSSGPNRFGSALICHSREDQAFALWLHDRLQRRGVRCWLREYPCPVEDATGEEIDWGVRRVDTLLLCASRHSLAGSWVEEALWGAPEGEPQPRAAQPRALPALLSLDLDGFMFSPRWQSAQKAQIQTSLAATFEGFQQDGALAQRELDKLATALRLDLERPVA